MAYETPLPVQAQVIAKHLIGESKTQIAKDLEISRTTVHTILNDVDIERIAQETKSILYSGSHKVAHRIVKDAAKSSAVGFELLDRLNILNKKEPGTSTNIAVGVNFNDMPDMK